MSAREVTAVAGAARALLEAHGATAEDAEMYAEKLTAAGLLIDPAQAEELLEDCRDQARAEHAAEVRELSEIADTRAEALVLLVNDLREQLKATRERVGEQQEQLAALRPPHRSPVPLILRWTRVVDEPPRSDGDTAVRCATPDGRPAELLLSPEECRALPAALVADEPGCLAECGGPGYTRCELSEGHGGVHESAMGSLRRVTWGGEDW